MMAAGTITAESGLSGRFWFKAALAGQWRHVMLAMLQGAHRYKESISTTPWRQMHGEMRDVSRFRAFGCSAWVYLNSDRRGNGKHTASEVEAINIGFERNKSAYCRMIPEENNLMASNQTIFVSIRLHSGSRKWSSSFKSQSDNSTEILYKLGTSRM
jgi:hypothetical protein